MIYVEKLFSLIAPNLKEGDPMKANWLFTSVAVLAVSCGAATLAASSNHSIGMDSNGNAVSVWQTYTFDGTIIQANTLEFSMGWGTPVTISLSESAAEPKIAVIANGTYTSAVAIWLETNGGVTSLYGAMMPYIETGWTTAAQISTNGEDVQNEYTISVNENFDVIATWAAYDSMFNEYIRSSTSTINGYNSWASPSSISGP